MTSARNSRIAQTLQYLRLHNHGFEFDVQERVVRVDLNASDVANADEAASHVAKLRDVEKLKFHAAGPSDRGLNFLAGATNLRELSFEGSAVTPAGFAHLGTMPLLEELRIRNPGNFDAVACEHLAKATSLRCLGLRSGKSNDEDLAPLAGLVNLEELSLEDNVHAHGTFCEHLRGLSKLRELRPGEQVTDEGLSCIAKLSSVDYLSIGGPFTDAGLWNLSALQNLDTLFIRSDHVTAEGIAVVATLPKLRVLYVDTLDLADAAIAPLLSCGALERLNFWRSALSDAALQQLRDGLPRCSVGDLQRDAWPSEPECDSGPRLESDTPFEVLLAEACDFDLVNSTFIKIGALYDHLVDASQYTPEQRVIMLVWHSAGIIGIGGFEDLFFGEFPGDPDFRITAETFRTAGLERSYDAFQAAFRLFPGGVAPCDPEERSRLYDLANRSARDALNRQVWHDWHVQLKKKLAEFIRRHAPLLRTQIQ